MFLSQLTFKIKSQNSQTCKIKELRMEIYFSMSNNGRRRKTGKKEEREGK
jgi:hypothetical protein